MNDPTAIAAMEVIKKRTSHTGGYISAGIQQRWFIRFNKSYFNHLWHNLHLILAGKPAKLLLQEINSEPEGEAPQSHHRTVVLKTKLLIRESTGGVLSPK
jgi:hypothetical protein